MTGIVVVNQGALSNDEMGELDQLFAGHPIVKCDPTEVSDIVRDALAKDVDFIAVAGGDGTMRAAAHELRGHQVPLLPVPAGTRNHFAKEMGITTFEEAAAAITGRPRRVDLGDVNGWSFINNSSIGLYPQLVRGREAREHRLPKGLANLVAAYKQLRHGRRIRIEVEGTTHWAWMVFVGNGCYGEDLFDLTKRASLDDNVLDVRVVKADRRFSRLRTVGAVLFGRLRLSPVVRISASRTVQVDLGRELVDVSLDGEVERLQTPLDYVSTPGSLVVLCGPDGR